MAFTTAMTTSFKVELATATHNFTTTSGNVFGVALGKVGAARTYDATTTNLSQLQTATTDEVANGSGYTTNGFLWTAAQNTTPASSSTTAFWSWSVNPNWTSASFSTIACLLYNSTSSGKSVYVGDFGGTQTVTSGTLTLVLPANAAGTSLLRIA
jgi:hypothetical protein